VERISDPLPAQPQLFIVDYATIDYLDRRGLIVLDPVVNKKLDYAVPVAEHSLWLAVVPFALLLLIYLPTLYDLVVDWYTDDNYSHGFLVPIVSAFLLWRKRQEISITKRSIDGRGLLVVIAGLGLFVIANGAAEYFTLRFSFVVTLFGLTLYLFGKELVRHCWFAFFFLLFMIPIPYVLYYAVTFPMQSLATTITVNVLDAIGMGVVRQGNIIHISGHSLEVAEACSGIRSLVSLLALGALFAYTTQKRFASQLLLFLSTVPIAVISNVFRVLITSLIVYTITDEVTQEPLHSIMGMSVFVVAFVLLFVFGMILRKVFK
jgi:exosortase